MDDLRGFSKERDHGFPGQRERVHFSRGRVAHFRLGPRVAIPMDPHGDDPIRSDEKLPRIILHADRARGPARPVGGASPSGEVGARVSRPVFDAGTLAFNFAGGGGGQVQDGAVRHLDEKRGAFFVGRKRAADLDVEEFVGVPISRVKRDVLVVVLDHV